MVDSVPEPIMIFKDRLKLIYFNMIFAYFLFNSRLRSKAQSDCGKNLFCDERFEASRLNSQSGIAIQHKWILITTILINSNVIRIIWDYEIRKICLEISKVVVNTHFCTRQKLFHPRSQHLFHFHIMCMKNKSDLSKFLKEKMNDKYIDVP